MGKPWGPRFASRSPSRAALGRVSVPLREFDGDAFGPVEEHELAGMEIHDLVARLEPARPELGDFGLDVIDRKADVVHAELVEVADVGI